MIFLINLALFSKQPRRMSWAPVLCIAIKHVCAHCLNQSEHVLYLHFIINLGIVRANQNHLRKFVDAHVQLPENIHTHPKEGHWKF